MTRDRARVNDAMAMLTRCLVVSLFLVACGGEGSGSATDSGSGTDGGSGTDSGSGTDTGTGSGSDSGSGSNADDRPEGGGVSDPSGGSAAGGSACDGIGAGGESRQLPGTGTSYCIKAHPDCTTEGAGCPLVITLNTKGAYHARVSDGTDEGKFIAVESTQKMDGNEVKDPLAELPRVIAAEYPGLDDQRIYLVGWSAGAGGVYRGMCQNSKGYDESSYGTTSDVYAAIATLGGCPNCSDGFAPKSGKWHVFATNGRDDQFGGDGCYDKLQTLAATNGCSAADPGWVSVPDGDAYVPDAPGTDVAEVADFGDCPGGDVLGYRFKDEGHVVSYKKNFDPKVKAYDLVWHFLQGKTKGD